MSLGRFVVFTIGWSLLLACDADNPRFRIVNKYPHDPTAYTQGLLFVDGELYESTGLKGQSSLRRVELATGRVVQQRRLDRRYFGEGLALVDGVFVQLTWLARKAFVYHSETFEPLREFSYDTEGWGLTYDGRRLIMSDGSQRLYFRDPTSFKLLSTIEVTDDEQPVKWLNELEFIDGKVWANVYRSDDIVIIEPATGKVERRLNMHGLLATEDRNGREDVLNGIAYDTVDKRVFITGKRYSFIYEIEIPDPS